MAKNINIDFDPTKSTFATKIYENRDKIENRYFIKGESKETIFLHEAADRLNSSNDEDFPLTFSLVNNRILNKLLIRYFFAVNPFIPKGMKINVDIFLRDFETFLSENKEKTRLSTIEITPFVDEIIIFMASTTNNLLEQQYGKMFGDIASV